MLTFHTLDVFTDRPFHGNPLAVVLNADGLTTDQMQTIARELNLSETIFVQAPQNPAHTARVRIFFPTAEIPFAGHPTIGCAIHLATAAHQGDFRADLVLEEEAGLVPVTVTRQGNQVHAEFTAPVLPYPTGALIPDALVAAAIGLPHVGFQNHRPGVFKGGPGFLYIPVATVDDLATAWPHEPEWSDLMTKACVVGAYLYTPGTDCDFRARMFSPDAGIAEDPATGSASAILAAQLLASGALSPGTTTLTLHQGVEMGRPSLIHLTVDRTAEDRTAKDTTAEITAIRIGGSAVPISHGQIVIPAPLGISTRRT